MGQRLPPLTSEFCLAVVRSSTPSPSKFHPDKDDPSVVTLFDMDVTTPIAIAMFVHGVKQRIFPWHIDDVAIASSRETTLQASADSIAAGARP
jgi:hypothetical protein